MSVMFYVIWVPADVTRLGIAANSEFKLYVADKGDMSLSDFVESELGLVAGEWAAI